MNILSLHLQTENRDRAHRHRKHKGHCGTCKFCSVVFSLSFSNSKVSERSRTSEIRTTLFTEIPEEDETRGGGGGGVTEQRCIISRGKCVFLVNHVLKGIRDKDGNWPERWPEMQYKNTTHSSIV